MTKTIATLTATVLLGMAAATIPAARAAPVLRCEPELVPPREGQDAETGGTDVKVGKRVVRLDTPSEMKAWSLRVYPADATSVLVALVYEDSDQEEPRGSDTLWRIFCKSSKPAAKVLQVADADFGHAELAQDGQTLYYTGPKGVVALHLGTKKSRRITRAVSTAG